VLIGNHTSYAIAFVLFMTPPRSWSSNGVAGWFGVMYIVFYAFDTIANVPYVALGPELTDSYSERDSVFFWCKIFDSVGIVIAVVTPAIIAPYISLEWRFTLIAIILGSIYLLSMSGLVFTVKERYVALLICWLYADAALQSGHETLRDQAPFVPSVLKSVTSKPFRPLLIGWILDFTALATLSSTLPFFITYIIRPANPDSLLAACIGSVFFAGVLTMPLFLWLSKRLGKFPTWCAFNLLNGVTCAFFLFLGEGSEVGAIVVSILNGTNVSWNTWISH
jgi:glycoside/pentoside/hexuronide:cation symporter, GPH family